MKAVRCCEKHVHVVDVPAPQGEGVLVKVRSAGICGSDLHMVAGGFPVTATLGHEVAGVLKDGTAVALEPIAPCGHCDMCVAGDYQMCRHANESIYGVARDGGMAEEILVPARCIVPLPGNVRPEDACLVEPLAVAAHGLAMLGLNASHRVAVVGAGSIGLCAVAVAQPVVKEVALFARHDAQKLAGDQLGATLRDANLDNAEEFHFVVDCAGTSGSMEQAVRLCRPGGTVLMLATYWEGLTVPAFEVGMKNLRLVSSSMYGRHGLTRDVDVAAQLMAFNPRIAQVMITHRMPLDNAAAAFAVASDRSAGAIKVVLEP